MSKIYYVELIGPMGNKTPVLNRISDRTFEVNFVDESELDCQIELGAKVTCMIQNVAGAIKKIDGEIVEIHDIKYFTPGKVIRNKTAYIVEDSKTNVRYQVDKVYFHYDDMITDLLSGEYIPISKEVE